MNENKADTSRVLASITATALAVAVVALSAAMFFDSIRWLSGGLLASLVAEWANRYRFTQMILIRDEATNNRILQIFTYWQADVHAVANGTPRPDPRALYNNQPPQPRKGEQEQQQERQEPA